MKMVPIRSSETSDIKTHTPGNYPKRNILQLKNGESLKTKIHPFYVTLYNYSVILQARADPGFVGPEACTIFRILFFEKEYKFTNTKLNTKVNIYLGPLLGPWKGPQ